MTASTLESSGTAPPHHPGLYGVLGPPGTGKTTYLSRQVRAAVDRYGPQAVIVSSLTRTAAAEIAGRDLPIDRSQVGTLHAFAYRALGHPDLAEDPKRIEAWNKAHPRPDRQLSGGKKADPEEQGGEDLGVRGGSPGDELNAEFQRLRARLTSRELWPVAVQAFARDWEAWKASEGLLDFTDLIETCLREIPACPGNPTVGFFDEAQDMAPLELALVLKWGSATTRFIVVGDDDQAIFAFRGASAEAFIGLIAQAAERRVLEQSWRVPSAVLTASQAWISSVARRETKAYRPRLDEAGQAVKGEVRSLPNATYRHPEAAVRDAEKQLEAGQRVMFLATAGFMLDPIKAVLKTAGLPFHNPYRRTRGDWNPLTPGRGLSASERLLAYLRLDSSTWGGQARWWTAEDLHRWLELVKADGLLVRGAKKAIDERSKGPWAHSSLEVSDLLEVFGETNLNELLETAEAADLRSDPDAWLRWLEPRLLATKKQSLAFPLAVARRRGAATLREEPRVILGTIHSVKGGEADVVYVFPDLSPSGMREWIVPGVGRDSIVRAMYVAATRAREALVLCGPAGPSVNWAPMLRGVRT